MEIEMKGIFVYQQMQELKRRGFSRNAVVARTGACWRTVDKYWDMTLEEYEEARLPGRPAGSALSERDETIVQWLREYPDIAAAQIEDWLPERYGSVGASDRTVRRHVADLRSEHGIARCVPGRDYVAIPELPSGHQSQVDFGQAWMPTAGGGRIKVRFSLITLARSRMKWGRFQPRPFTQHDLARDMRGCWSAFGGRTDEYVFDQDAVLCVSENAGDIVMTAETEALRAEVGFAVYLCRAADPESKGKVGNGVKYVKRNFLAHRTYPGSDEALQRDFLAWLERTGNAKPNATTKVAPAALFEEERVRLIPVAAAAPIHAGSERRRVRRDNTILYRQNRYSLPLGTHNTTPDVYVAADDGMLRIWTTAGVLLAEHAMSLATGVLV